MIGLGPGARSYTQALHYSTEYAVGQTGVKAIIANFNSRDDGGFASADYGAALNVEEQKLRYVIKSLLRADGISRFAYQELFGPVTGDATGRGMDPCVLRDEWRVGSDTGVTRVRDNAADLLRSPGTFVTA